MENLPNRKSVRLENYDYSQNGTYFITICTKYRKRLLSKIIVGDGILDVPKTILTKQGKIADKYVNQMNDFYDNVSVDKYVIMPNHIHLLLTVKNGTSRTPSPTNSTISKYIGSFKRFTNKEFDENIWQRSFYEHIVRNTEDYLNIFEYIQNNPLNWNKDNYYLSEENNG